MERFHAPNLDFRARNLKMAIYDELTFVLYMPAEHIFYFVAVPGSIAELA